MIEKYTLINGNTEIDYWEEDGLYFRQERVFWNKGGYFIPQAKHKITKKEFELMKCAEARKHE